MTVFIATNYTVPVMQSDDDYSLIAILLHESYNTLIAMQPIFSSDIWVNISNLWISLKHI
ncbi:hypothetical protein FF38_01042 [Lucilia cuprina]|uniref:Uncharacterized protein n=1 Tax=Lucilia cuprina TaxID=7375 RepID=A0A0L0BT58_LUCCU|nr:hypothetical protein FF38_01042 [Lucilia cuprina]